MKQIVKQELMKNDDIVIEAEAAKKCGCGKTKDVNGNCDGSHAN